MLKEFIISRPTLQKKNDKVNSSDKWKIIKSLGNGNYIGKFL